MTTATRRRRPARTAVFAGLFAVVAAHLWLAVRVETDKPHWRDPEFFQRTRAARELTETDPRPLLAILGGSRPQMGLNPESLGDDVLAYNFSQSGCLPVGAYLNYTRLHDEGLKPRYLLIEVLPPVLADGGPADDRLSSVRLSAEELERLEPFDRDAEAARAAWRTARLLPWSTLRSPLLAAAGFDDRPASRNWNGMTERGWSPAPKRPTSAADREDRTLTAQRTYAWLLNGFIIQATNDRAYRAILGSCRARGIRAALFTMPESPRFRSWYPATARAEIRKWLEGLAKEYGVPVFDTSEWIDDETAFLDGHHLQRTSAERFSERFGRECVGPWVRKP
jgi:hypothetical protein